VCGVGLLCRLPFPPAFLLPLVAWRCREESPRLAAASVLLPVIILAPWLIDNLHRYGAVTAATVVKKMQGGFLNPGNRPYGLGRVAHTDITLLNAILPEEWANTTLFIYQGPNSLPTTMLHALRFATVVLICAPLLLWLMKGPRQCWLLLAPLLVALLLTQLDTIAIRLPLIQPRYLYPYLPAFGIAAGLTLIRAAGVRASAATAAILTGSLAALWAYLATIPPLTGWRGRRIAGWWTTTEPAAYGQ
jgi:hypothetical protein